MAATRTPSPPYLGAAYYPEAWPEGTIEQDIARAKEIGINTMRVGEFAWSRMERHEGAYDFGWLHRVVDRLGEEGFAVVMCTPTATPPAWLTRKYPEVLVVGVHGRALVHGSRRHVCPTSPVYRGLSAAIVTRMAEEFASDPTIIGWQIDNEYGCHVNQCFCPACRERWPRWLEARYGSLDALNTAWGTELWSQWYTDWSEIPLPEQTGFIHHPSLVYCWRNFMSDMYAEQCLEQHGILKAHGAVNVTTDGMPHFHRLDYETMFAGLDLIANNCYFPPEHYAGIIGECDWMRPRRSRPYWFTESAVGYTGAGSVGSLYLPRPGSIRARGWLMYALGGEMVLYWLYRCHWSGQEMLHGSLLYNWGDMTVGAGEVAELSRDLERAGGFLRATAVPRAQAAIHYHTPSSWMLDYEPQVPGLHYDSVLLASFHRPLVEANIMRDILFSGDDLSGYRILFSPLMAWIPEETLERILAAVRDGMTWVVGPLSSIRSRDETLFRDCALGPLERALPFRVAHRFPATGIDPTVVWTDGCARQKATLWCDVFVPESDAARPWAMYEGGPCAGGTAALDIEYGHGRVRILGFLPEPTDQAWLHRVTAEAGVEPVCRATEGIAVVPRVGEGQRGYIAFDWRGSGGHAALPVGGVDLLTGEPVADGIVSLGPYGVAAVRT